MAPVEFVSQLGVAESDGAFLAPAVLDVGVVVGQRAVETLPVSLENVWPRAVTAQRLEMRYAAFTATVGKMPTSESASRLSVPGSLPSACASMMCMPRPSAGFESLGLEQRIRVGERQHAPVELGAEQVAFLEIEVAEIDVARQRCWLKRLSLK